MLKHNNDVTVQFLCKIQKVILPDEKSIPFDLSMKYLLILVT